MTCKSIVSQVNQLREQQELTLDALRPMLRAYVLNKFHLSEAESAGLSLDELTQTSIDKMREQDPQAEANNIRAATCDGANEVDTKQALLIVSIQKDFGVKVDALKAALAESLDELAEAVFYPLVSKECPAQTTSNAAVTAKPSSAKNGSLDVSALRRHFPILRQHRNGQPLAYLDNAASMHMPKPVAERLIRLRETGYSNVHRGAHTLSQRCTDSFDDARATVAEFLSTDAEQVVFTSGATDGINQLAKMVEPRLTSHSNIVVTAMEHHSNLLPWVELSNRTGCQLRVAPVRQDGSLDEEALLSLVDGSTALCSFTQMSNVTGAVNPCRDLCVGIKAKSDASIVIDGAQGVVHQKHKPAELGCDAYVFSGHKLGSPTGIGVLWLSKDFMEGTSPASFGGGTVSDVTLPGFTLYEGISRFEPGTPHIDGAVGLAETIRFWSQFDEDAIRDHMHGLYEMLLHGLSEVPGLQIVGSMENRSGVASFAMENLSPYKTSKVLDEHNVAIRSGKHCAQPYLADLGFKDCLRASIAPYNSAADIQQLLDALHAIASK